MNHINAKYWLLILQAVTFLNSASSEDYHEILGKAIYIPDEDLLGSIPNGISFFKDVNDNCQRKINAATTVKDQTFYQNTQEFYKSVATETNLKASYEGGFSLGFTLDVTSKTVSGSKRDVSGTSLNLATKSFVQQFSPNCLYETTLHSRVASDFASLPTQINNPWHKSSWRQYQIFLETHGSHVITAVTFGSSIDQYAFAERTSSYTSKELTVKACASLGVSKVSVSACSGVTKEDINKLSSARMTTSITVRGGSINLRNKLVYERSDDLIIQFLAEGHNHPTPITYTLTPIWEILRRHRPLISENRNSHVQAVNLQYYFAGYLNFGCPYKASIRHGTPPLQMFDYAAHSSSSNPVFQCSIAPQGCHSNNDCHYQIGVKCECRGSSCIKHGYTNLTNGKTRVTAAPNYARRWSWQGCNWKLWGSRCHCRNPNPKRRVIF